MYGRKQEKIKYRQVIWRQTPIVLQFVSPEYVIFEEALIQSQLIFCMSSSSLIYLCTKKVWQFWKMRSWSKTASKLQNEIKSLMSRKTMPEFFWFVLIFQPFLFRHFLETTISQLYVILLFVVVLLYPLCVPSFFLHLHVWGVEEESWLWDEWNIGKLILFSHPQCDVCCWGFCSSPRILL